MPLVGSGTEPNGEEASFGGALEAFRVGFFGWVNNIALGGYLPLVRIYTKTVLLHVQQRPRCPQSALPLPSDARRAIYRARSVPPPIVRRDNRGQEIEICWLTVRCPLKGNTFLFSQ